MRFIASVVGTLILVIAAYFEVQHDFSDKPWPGFTIQSNNVVYLLLPIWIVGIVSFWSTRRWTPVALLFVSIFTAAHGFVVGVGETYSVGLQNSYLFLLAGLSIAACTLVSKTKYGLRKNLYVVTESESRAA